MSSTSAPLDRVRPQRARVRQPARVQPADRPAGQTESQAGSSWARALDSIVLIDFLLGALLVLDRFALPGLPMPTGVALTCTAIALGFTRRPTLRQPKYWAVTAVFALMLVWAVAVSEASGLDWHQRALRMALLLALALTFATGRLHVRSWLWGVSVGLVANAGAYYAGLTSDQYPPYLTGFFGDKNVSGLWYGLFLVLGLMLHRSVKAITVHLVIFGGLLFLTGSRTSLTGATAGLLWWLARNRLTVVARLALAGLGVWVIDLVERRFARVGVFSNRDESDWFRHQIDIATAAKVAGSPWYGNGLTTAWVQLTQYRWIWFHDSYAALRVEGGWVMVAVVLALFVWWGGGVLWQRKVSRELAIAEGAIVVVLVCAWKLGEVFFTTPAFLILGIALALRWGTPRETVAIGGTSPLATDDSRHKGDQTSDSITS